MMRATMIFHGALLGLSRQRYRYGMKVLSGIYALMPESSIHT